jgi:hypothetical protein
LRNAGALALRYQAQTHGYLLLLTDAYPYGGPARNAAAGAAAVDDAALVAPPQPKLGLD